MFLLQWPACWNLDFVGKVLHMAIAQVGCFSAGQALFAFYYFVTLLFKAGAQMVRSSAMQVLLEICFTGMFLLEAGGLMIPSSAKQVKFGCSLKDRNWLNIPTNDASALRYTNGGHHVAPKSCDKEISASST